MNYMDDASTFERSFLQKARRSTFLLPARLTSATLQYELRHVLCPSVPFRNGMSGTTPHS